MAAVLKPVNPVSKTDPDWSDNRLVLFCQLMALLPTSPTSGVTFEEIKKELGVGKDRLFRLFRAMRKADLDVESVFSAQGSKVYYFPRQRQSLINRILRNS